MRQVVTSFLFISILFLLGCTPSKKVIDSSTPSTNIFELNIKLAAQDVSIELTNKEEIQPDSSHISSDHLTYFKDGYQKTVSLGKVRLIKISPKLSYSTIIGSPLIAYGGVSSYLFLNGNISSAHWTTQTALPALLAGLGIFIFGNTAETEIYHFD